MLKSLIRILMTWTLITYLCLKYLNRPRSRIKMRMLSSPRYAAGPQIRGETSDDSGFLNCDVGWAPMFSLDHKCENVN